MMKKIALYSLLLAFIACSNSQISHTDTAKIVIESFYQNNNSTLKKHTTEDSYASYMSIQAVIAPGDPKSKRSNFKVQEETVDGDIAWVKFTTSYSVKPETFKLIKQDGKWKVELQGVREKGPF